jgi:hypothetical protein
VRLSRFYELVTDEFGADFAPIIINDTRITALSDLTPAQALSQGAAVAEVWMGICQQLQVPQSRWHGQPLKPNAK